MAAPQQKLSWRFGTSSWFEQTSGTRSRAWARLGNHRECGVEGRGSVPAHGWAWGPWAGVHGMG